MFKKLSHFLFGHPNHEFEVGKFYARCHGCRSAYKVEVVPAIPKTGFGLIGKAHLFIPITGKSIRVRHLFELEFKDL